MARNGNVYVTLGASNHALSERQPEDLYCTHPRAVEELLELETFSPKIWESCDGLGHISDVLTAHGYDVRRSDLYTRGRDIEQLDFLTADEVWISSRRIPCGKDGKFGASAQGYAWYVWKKGYEGETTLKWF